MRDIDIGGVYAPPILIIFLVSLALVWWIDRLVAMTGAYRLVWHPSLFRVSLFACVFFGASLCHYA